MQGDSQVIGFFLGFFKGLSQESLPDLFAIYEWPCEERR